MMKKKQKKNQFGSNLELTRRKLLKISFIGGAAMFIPWHFKLPEAVAAIPGGDLDLTTVPKFQTPMLIPPVMPRAGTIKLTGGKNADYYEISMKQFNQQILPPLPAGYHGLGLRRHNSGQQERAPPAQRPIADHRSQA